MDKTTNAAGLDAPQGGGDGVDLGLLLSQISTQRAYEGAADRAEVEGSAAKMALAAAPTVEVDEGHELRLSPGLVRLVAPPRQSQTGGGPRGRVVGFSAASRRRLLQTLGTLDLAAVTGLPVFVTLTYPGDWRSCCPDGREAKRHLDLFRRRWLRRWGVFPAVWKLEFQPRRSQPVERRLAPHFHILASVPTLDPSRPTPTPTSMSDVREWASETWWEVVGSGDERHRRAGTQVLEADGSTPGRLVGYFAGYTAGRSKEEQHEAPPDWPGLGRYWGVWGIARIEVAVGLSDDAFFSLRRVLAELMARRRGVKRRRLSNSGDGLWLGIDTAPELVERLSRWLVGDYPPRVLP